jgi:GT2 family glycosyltransferase
LSGRPRLSVVVASHGRPIALRRCLLVLSQSTLADLEVIVVADAAGLDVAAGLPFGGRLKTALQGEANLAQARNDGIARAAGDVVAFLDDDAAPEPTWAAEVLAAFAGDPGLGAATGPVIGRNGISLQWGPMAVDRQGRDARLSSGDTPLPTGAVRKLHGTNMAIRRDVLDHLGGFDTAFRYYLDDTDLSLRLAFAGHSAAWLPRAQVHHAFAASPRRDADRVPLSLHDIGASTAAFLRKHSPNELDEALSALAGDQRLRLFRLARRRKIGARDIERLLDSLRAGIEEGRRRPVGEHAPIPQGAEFMAVRDVPGGSDEVLAGWRFRAATLRAEAERRVREGARVSLFLLEPTPRAHRVAFTDGGWWEQTGGLYGRSDRDMPRFQAWRLRSRLYAEVERVAPQRFATPPIVRFHGA